MNILEDSTAKASSLLRLLSTIPVWGHGSFEELTEITEELSYNKGDLSPVAYTFVPELVRLSDAQNRTMIEKGLVVGHLLDVVMGPFSSTPFIAVSQREAVESAIHQVRAWAKLGLSGAFPFGMKLRFATAWLLAPPTVLAAAVVHGLSIEELMMTCPCCAQDLSAVLTGEGWRVIGRSGTTPIIEGEDFFWDGKISGIVHEMRSQGVELGALDELRGDFECPECGRVSTTTKAVGVGLAKGTPLVWGEWREALAPYLLPAELAL